MEGLEGEGRLNEWARRVQKDELLRREGRIGRGRKVKWMSEESTKGWISKEGRKDWKGKEG